MVSPPSSRGPRESTSAGAKPPRSPDFFLHAELLALFITLYELKSRVIWGWGRWYGTDQHHRLQTMAMLRGHLALQDTPIGHLHDWVWHNGGMYQVWGIGVPLLRLPFELLALPFGGYFPDRVIFLAYFTLAAAILWFAAPFTDEAGRSGDRIGDLCLRVTVTILCLGNSAFLNLTTTVFGVYEETIAYNYLWATMLFGALLILARRPGPRFYLVLCAACGFAPLIRQTGFLYGAATFVAASIFLRGMGLKRFLLGGALFSIGPLLTLCVQKIFFGGFFEWGASNQMTDYMYGAYVSRFGGLVTGGIRGSLRDFFLAMFFPRLLGSLRTAESKHVELYYENFSPAVFALFVAALVAIPALAIAARRRGRHARDAKDGLPPHTLIALAWSLPVFLALQAIYVRFFIISRYISDVSLYVMLPVAAGAACLIHAARRVGRPWERRLIQIAPAGAALAWLLAQSPEPYRGWTIAVDRAATKAAVRGQRAQLAEPRAQLPSAYTCGAGSQRHGIPYNTAGWRITGDCSVEVATLLFFASPACLEMEIEFPAAAPRGEILDGIRVKAGKTDFQAKGTTIRDGRTLVGFCAPGSRPVEGVQDVMIGWLPPETAGLRPPPLIRLLAARSN